MDHSNVLLQVNGLSKSFSGNRVLKDVSFEIRPGEVLALVGENGAGKSTLINILTGVLAPDSGEFIFGDNRVTSDGHTTRWGPRQAREQGLDAVHQELSLSPHLTVAENLYLGRWPTQPWAMIDRRQLYREAAAIIKQIGVRIDPHTLLMHLSLGEQQLVELAKTLSAQPTLLVLDEATSALDDDQVAAVFRAVSDLRQRGCSAVFVSHRLGEVFAISDRIAVLKDGALVAVRDTSATDNDELVKLMVGRDLQELFPDKSGPPSTETPVLSVHDLRSGQEFQDISFDVAAGQIMGLGGLQGQGQKDVMRSLFGLKSHSGSIQISGAACSVKSPRDAMQHGIAYVPEDRKTEGLLVQQSVQFNASLPSMPGLSNRLLTVNRAREAALVQDLISRLQIKVGSMRQTVRRLSGGNQQKVALGKWLAIKPRIYLLDEPTRGIDVGTKREIYFLLRRLASEGAVILMTSSDTMELVGLCDSISVMYEGKVVKVLEGDEVTEENVVRASVIGSGEEDQGRESA